MRKTLLLLFAGLVAGMATCTLLQKKHPSSPLHPAVPYLPVKHIQQQRQKEEADYQRRQQQLHREMTTLNNAYQSVVNKLALVKKENRHLQQQVNRSIDSLQNNTDTLAYMLHCDSLQQQVQQLSTGYAVQDTLREKQVNNLQQQLHTKDQHLVAADNRVRFVNTLLDNSLSQNKQLETALKLLQKKAKRQRLSATLKTIGFTVLAWGVGRRL